MSPFHDWETFYVIVGSSAAALTGLQFVVIALVADSKARSTLREIDAFGTPTIVHFGAVFLLSAILSAPWHGLSGAALLVGAAGFVGIFYTGLVIHRARAQTGYRLVPEDWLFHIILPLAVYGSLAAGALTLRGRPEPSLFLIGGAAVLLLFVGVHNAWDTVTYIAVTQPRKAEVPEETASGLTGAASRAGSPAQPPRAPR